jgi:hypothetical protein
MVQVDGKDLQSVTCDVERQSLFNTCTLENVSRGRLRMNTDVVAMLIFRLA